MLASHGKHIESREARGITASSQIKLRAHPTHEFRAVAFRRQHPAQEQETTGLNGFGISSKRLRRCGQGDTKVFQSTLGP